MVAGWSTGACSNPPRAVISAASTLFGRGDRRHRLEEVAEASAGGYGARGEPTVARDLRRVGLRWARNLTKDQSHPKDVGS